MALGRLFVMTIAAIGFVSIPAVADDSGDRLQHVVDPATNIESWILHNEGVEVELIQIAPDQARGFFLARGFNRKDADFYADSCVLATIVRNKSFGTISYNLANWRYTPADGVMRKLKLKDKWLQEWGQRGVSKSAQIAFEWSQHPSIQTLEPNDWNQGMIPYRVPHGELFDLTVEWDKKGYKKYVDTIRGIRCAN